jgi:hypothetical protein
MQRRPHRERSRRMPAVVARDRLLQRDGARETVGRAVKEGERAAVRRLDVPAVPGCGLAQQARMRAAQVVGVLGRDVAGRRDR